MAYDILEQNDPEALQRTNTLLQFLTDFDPSLTPKEERFPFVECATLADDIKWSGGSW